MKKIMFLFVCLFGCASVNAQHKGLWISPVMSAGKGKIASNSLSYLPSKKADYFSAGAEAVYMFKDQLGAGAGLAYSVYNTQWSGDAYELRRLTMHQAAIDIPTFVRYARGARHGFMVQAGVVHRVSIASNQRTEAHGVVISKLSGSASNASFSSYTINPFVFIGCHFALSDKTQLLIGPYGQWQANNNFSAQSGMKGGYLIGGIKLGFSVLTYKG